MIHLFRNFLSAFDAECLAKDIMASLDTELAYAFHSIEKEEPLYLDNRPDNAPHIEHHKQVAGVSLQQQEVGLHYRFKRSLPHTEECPCFECVFRNKALKTFVKEFIEEKLEWEEAILAENFISAFYPGDFLSTHNDDNGAGIAFVLNLNKDWKPEYGGMLHVKQGDGTYLAIEPQFNSLVVMELGDEGIDHFVSEVSAFAPKPRIAISGWYNKGDGASNESNE